MKTILITGGGGYVGSVLVNYFLEKNKKIIVLDTFWFGNYLPKHKNLKIIKGDTRFFDEKILKDVSSVVHLANVANDPAVDLNPTLSWEINVLATYNLISKCIKYKVKQFIFASSGSVYGVKKDARVTEDLSLIPISTYNKTKMVAERVLMSYSNQIKIHCIRPATVCGLSPRMRFDVSVNDLTIQALTKKKITVFGGNQIRPNIHINDMVNLYDFFINNPNIKSGFYNAGFENISIMSIAKLVSKVTNAKIEVTKLIDQRSYRQDSTKILKLGFKNKFKVIDAINDIKKAFELKKLKVTPNTFTVKWMKKNKIL
jgi:nucleoside-diphosphate-sugar epimerase